MRAELLCLALIFSIQAATAVVPAHLAAQTRSVSVSGLVRDASSGEPVSAVTVIHDNLVVGVTNEAGMYEVPVLSVSGPSFTLVYRRIGYSTSEQNATVPDSGSQVRLDLTLLPAPTDLERIIVSGERIAVANPGLVGFYERRERGFGRYLTGEEIQRIGGIDLTNHLRRLRVRAEFPDLRDPFSRPTFSECYVAFVDGIRLMDLTTINEWVPARSLGGIEVHRPNEISNLPREFVTPPPPGCQATAGVIMFWSDVLREPSPFEFGLHLGALWGGEEDAAGQYLGASFVTRVRGGETNLRLHLDVSARIAGKNSKWQAFLNFVTRPFGRDSPIYAGIGAGLSKRGATLIEDHRESLVGHHTVLTGLNFSAAFVRPFVQVLVLDPLRPNSVAVLTSLGLRMPIGF